MIIQNLVGAAYVYKTGTGLRINNPSWEAIEKILYTLPRVPHNSNYITYTLSDEPAIYMQTRPEEGKDSFKIEYRDGKAKRHFGQGNVCLCVVVVMLRSYHSQNGKWRNMGEWKDISTYFKGW
jgi:hypothetical protein